MKTDWPPERSKELVLPQLPPTLALIWSSPASRCVGVASAIAQALETPLIVDERLAELDHGQWEGRLWSEIYAEDAVAMDAWGRHWQTVGPPDGESAEQLELRVRAAWSDCMGVDGDVLWVTHAGVIRALLKHQRGLSWPAAMGLCVEPLSVHALPRGRRA